MMMSASPSIPPRTSLSTAFADGKPLRAALTRLNASALWFMSARTSLTPCREGGLRRSHPHHSRFRHQRACSFVCGKAGKRSPQQPDKSIGVGAEKDGIPLICGEAGMHEQKLIDAGESDLGPVTAGLPFEGLCIFEQLENPIVYIPAVERPIPPKDQFKRGRRERLLENAAMSGWSSPSRTDTRAIEGSRRGRSAHNS